MPDKKNYKSIVNNPERYKRYLEKKKVWVKAKRSKYPFTHFSKDFQQRRNAIISPFEFWKIAKRQKLICPLTGRKLTDGTLSVDHIIPLCKGGKNDESNIQFVHVDANYAKRILLQEDFIVMCNDVAKHHPR